MKQRKHLQPKRNINSFVGKAGSRWSILLTKNVAFVNVINRVGNRDKKILTVYQKLDNRSIIWQSIKNIGPVLLFLMQNQILSTFTPCSLCYHFSVLSENKQFQLIGWVIPVWIVINFSVCLVLIKILIVWIKPPIFWHLQFLIPNVWCQCYWPSWACLRRYKEIIEWII